VRGGLSRDQFSSPSVVEIVAAWGTVHNPAHVAGSGEKSLRRRITKVGPLN
jgi:hypothetical protein